MNPNQNLYAILAANFPSERSACAIAASASDTSALYYTWADIDTATAQLANLLRSLGLGSAARVAAYSDKSVEAMLLYLATLRAGLVYVPLHPLPLNPLPLHPPLLHPACPPAALAHLLARVSPGVLVCAPAAFGSLSKQAFAAGVGHVFTLGCQRDGSLLARAARHAPVFDTAQSAGTDTAAIVYASGACNAAGYPQGTLLSHGDLSLSAAATTISIESMWATAASWARGCL